MRSTRTNTNHIAIDAEARHIEDMRYFHTVDLQYCPVQCYLLLYFDHSLDQEKLGSRVHDYVETDHR